MSGLTPVLNMAARVLAGAIPKSGKKPRRDMRILLLITFWRIWKSEPEGGHTEESYSLGNDPPF